MANRRVRPAEHRHEAPLAIVLLVLAAVGLADTMIRRAALLIGPTGERATAALHLATRALAAVLGLGGALLLVALVLRGACTWRTLRSRVAYAVLPPLTFDPRPEEIEVFGQQLLGVRRRVLGWLDRPACAVRIRLTTAGAGRALYVIELPARFRGSLFNAFASAYPGVELRPLAEMEEVE